MMKESTRKFDTYHMHHTARHKHGEGSCIDFYAYHSGIRHWNSAFKSALSAAMLILSISLDNPYVSIIVMIAMGYLTIIKGGLPMRTYLSVMMIPITFIILGTIAIGVEVSTQPLGQYRLDLGFFYLFTTNERLKMMLFLILKVFAAVSAMEMLTLSTPSAEIIGVLQKARVPKLIIELMNIIYRYIFILIDVYVTLRNAADSRLGFCDLKTSWFTFGKIASNLLIVSLKKANAYYNAMEARCYDGDFMILEESKEIKPLQAITSTGFIILLIAVWGLTK